MELYKEITVNISYQQKMTVDIPDWKADIVEIAKASRLDNLNMVAEILQHTETGEEGYLVKIENVVSVFEEIDGKRECRYTSLND